MEKRAFPRFRAEVMVDFALSETKATGMTVDVSLGGMFVRTTRIPDEGSVLFLTMHLPQGTKILLHGEVVRVFRASGVMRDRQPTGFGYRVSATPIYERFVQSVAGATAAAQ